ncbi:hypothetical protein KOI35_26105 [Actinoplanes bogorensis]|uniref:DUF4175 domain-containing protein n=1 Tax=Paractinoplanes bogorensis TaxID=1610840 RepID=A0ABS5YY01_9ACTN|nr:hypothetical protein [Actinoplanes bogorensis]MBU2666990.1 hypothetical protein [Actinoplanes bogorensis]
MAISRFWLRWFGSRPHLVGAGVALLLIVAALLGVLETLLRPHFGIWWLVVLAGYVVGWFLTGVVMWLPGHVIRKDVAPRGWASIALPELAPRPASRGIEHKGRMVIGMVVFVFGVLLTALIIGSPARAEALGGIMSGLGGLFGLYVALRASAKPVGRHHKDPPTGP